jgi:hypothetical protein
MDMLDTMKTSQGDPWDAAPLHELDADSPSALPQLRTT